MKTTTTPTQEKRARLKRRVSREDYNQIKTLQGLGLKAKQVDGIIGFSYTVIIRAFKSDTWDDWLARLDNMNRHTIMRRQEQELPVSIDVSVSDSDTVGVLASTEVTTPEPSSLIRIATALERLADAWETSPKKKFF